MPKDITPFELVHAVDSIRAEQARRNERQTNVETLLTLLMRELGYDCSESAAEAFVSQLQNACDSLCEVIDQSHDEELCYNCIPALASRLSNTRIFKVTLDDVPATQH